MCLSVIRTEQMVRVRLAASKAASFHGVVSVVEGVVGVKLVQAGRSMYWWSVCRGVFGAAQRNTVLQWEHSVSHANHIWTRHVAVVSCLFHFLRWR